MPYKGERDDSRRDRRFKEENYEAEHFRKIFVGGLLYDTTKEDLEKHFNKYGEIVDCVVMIYPDSKRSRGFGFVTFDTIDAVDALQEDRPHMIDGKEVETKRATPREQNHERDSKLNIKKVFIGGLPEETTEDDIRAAFTYGSIAEVDILKHRETGKPRGFCFVVFDDFDPVDKICMKGWVEICGKKVEVSRATPKGEDPYANERGSNRDRGGRGRGGRGGDRFSRNSSRGDGDRGSRFRSRSPVRDRFSSRSSGGFGSGGSSNFSSGFGSLLPQGGSGDSFSNLGQLAPALASLGTLVGLMNNQQSQGSNSNNALSTLMSALQGANSGQQSSEQTSSRSFTERDSSFGGGSGFGSGSGFGGGSSSFSSGFGNSGNQGYSAAYSSGFGSGFNRSSDDYSR